MEQSKVWVIIGASEGLGPATVKYLLAKNQTVIALTTADDVTTEKLKELMVRHELFDFLIVNSGYELVDRLVAAGSENAQISARQLLITTLHLVKRLLPFMKSGQDGHIIQLPLNPCLVPPFDALTQVVNQFSADLRTELVALNQKFTCYDSLSFI